jgi:hypothetical protein
MAVVAAAITDQVLTALNLLLDRGTLRKCDLRRHENRKPQSNNPNCNHFQWHAILLVMDAGETQEILPLGSSSILAFQATRSRAHIFHENTAIRAISSASS